jgi:arginine decarboxylase
MHEDGYELEQVVEGETVSEVLDYVQFHETVLIDRMKRELQNARNKGLITAREANAFFSFYQEGLQGYTYLEEETPLRL